MRSILGILIMMVMALSVGKAEATLTATGTGLVCDNVSNLCWNQNANLSGFKNWQDQVDWANNLSLAGFDDYRLATISELQSLYNQLKALAVDGCSGNDCTGGPGPFTNVQSYYWSSTEVDSSTALVFQFWNGSPTNGNKILQPLSGWAVRQVPEPGTAVLLGLGLLGMGVVRRWRGR